MYENVNMVIYISDTYISRAGDLNCMQSLIVCCMSEYSGRLGKMENFESKVKSNKFYL